MPRAPAAPIRGIVTSLQPQGTHVPRVVQEAARRHGIDLGEIDIGVLRSIIPSGLGSEIPSWIILYSEQDDSDLILVPYVNQLMTDDRGPAATLMIEKVFASIRVDRDAVWSAGIGHRNLVAAEAEGFLPVEARCFQAVRLPDSLRRHLRGAVSSGNELSGRFVSGISGWLEDASERIAGKRKILQESLAHADPRQAEQARADFDTALLAEATRMAERARFEGYVSEPPLVEFLLRQTALDGLDEECKTFLRTALLCEELGLQEPEGKFDFASAGGSLCKIVERELNMSMGWLVRWLREVAARESPWIARTGLNPDTPVEVRTGPQKRDSVNLNVRESDNPERLKGLMLGAIQHLLSFAHSNGVRVEVLGQPLGDEWTVESLDLFIFGGGKRRNASLEKAISKLTGLRNPYAHDKAMDRKHYDKLKRLVIGGLRGYENSLAARIVSLKRAIGGFLATR